MLTKARILGLIPARREAGNGELMSFIKGIKYNIKGLLLGLRTPKLLMLGLIRFSLIILVTALAVTTIFYFHDSILKTIWQKPQSGWFIWLWHLVSWLLTIILMGMSAVIAYLISQILFAVVIMDQMSRLTEKIATGTVTQDSQLGWWQQFAHLIKQEIPRAILPVFFTLFLTVISWLTPLGPLMTLLLSGAAVVFIAWDSTDLTPARRLHPFGPRFRFLMQTLPFHLGFGILFLIPIANILFLAFAPVGATLYYLETQNEKVRLERSG